MGVYGQAGTPITGNPPSCRVKNSAAQLIAHDTNVVVTFGAEAYDTDNMHDNVTNPSRITINTAGVYVVTFTGELQARNDWNFASCFIQKNGVTPISVGAITGTLTINTIGAFLNCSTIYKCIVGDYLEVVVRHKNTAALANNLNATNDYSAQFAATWIGLGT